MIHLFNGAKSVCTLPGQLCTQCGKVCHSLNCDPIRNCCNSASKFCTQFTDKPLSSFVVIAWLMSLLELNYCYNALNMGTIRDCVFPEGTGASVGITTWLYVQMAFAVLNIFFAPWFQHQVWNQIMQNFHQSLQQDCSLAQDPVHIVKSRDVVGAFKHVILFDFGVLFYFLASCASFVWSWMGGGWIMSNKTMCNSTGDAGWAYYMGLCFLWVLFFFSFCYSCCTCCAGSVQLSAPITSYGPEEDPEE